MGPPPSQILRSQVPRVHSLFWAHPQVKFSDHKFRVFIHCFGPTPKSNSQITSSACSLVVLGPPRSQILRSQVPRVHSLYWAQPQVKFSDHKFRVFIHCFGPTPKSNSQITSSTWSFVVLGPPPSQSLRSQVPRVHSLFRAQPQVKFSDHKFRVFIHCVGPTPKSNSQFTSSACSFIVLGPPPNQILRSQVPRVHSLFWAHPQVKFSDHKFRVFIHCFGPTPKSNSQFTSSACSFIVLGPPPNQILRSQVPRVHSLFWAHPQVHFSDHKFRMLIHCFGPTSSQILRSQVPRVHSLFWAHPQVKFSDHKFRVFIHCFGPTLKSNSQITSSACSFIFLGPPPSQILRSQVPRVHSLYWAHPQVKFSDHKFRVFIHYFGPTPKSNSQITSSACSFIALGPPPSQILRSQVPRVH